MDGVLLIDKPQGLTSHDVVAVARRCLGERRIGHTGTLDPLATGLLPLVCGRATRLSRFLTASEKEYQATVRFGLTTDTYDVTGQEVARTDASPSREALEDSVAAFRGEYLQTPPAHSAKKVQGRRAYELARSDQEVVLQPVPVRVRHIELLDFRHTSATFRVVCSAGFYVRSFAHELGARVGTGAALEALRRTRSGTLTVAGAVPLATLQTAPALATDRLIPLEGLLLDFSAVQLNPEGRKRVGHGQSLEPAHYETVRGTQDGPPGEWTRLMDAEGRLVALGAAGRGHGVLHPVIVLI